MRRKGRVCALQILYQMDLTHDLDGQQGLEGQQVGLAMATYWSSFDAVAPDDQAFAERLVYGVMRHLGAMDDALATASHHWRIHRMGKVDRNLLRLAAYELLCCDDIPRAASINEAIEIAKAFSGNESAAFVNGILDQLAKRATLPPSMNETLPEVSAEQIV